MSSTKPRRSTTLRDSSSTNASSQIILFLDIPKRRGFFAANSIKHHRHIITQALRVTVNALECVFIGISGFDVDSGDAFPLLDGDHPLWQNPTNSSMTNEARFKNPTQKHVLPARHMLIILGDY